MQKERKCKIMYGVNKIKDSASYQTIDEIFETIQEQAISNGVEI